MARPIDGTWDSFLLNLSYLTLKDFQENKAGLNTLKTAVEFQPTITSSNEALTIEQLRGMVGQWVWVVIKYEHCTCDGWALITTPVFLSYLDQTLPIDFYGRKFTAYRHPPEGEEET